MKHLTGNQTRQLFLDFFKSKGHMIEPGASLVPINDPTLLWVNAGVAALKKYFDGREKPLNNRITNAQKSIRTNDIENVGKTARHHTFFEMLGNFSIGDYFKEDAIKYAYEFLTSDKWIGMDPNKIYVTVYSDDIEAYNIWVNVIGFDPKRILKTHNNYWEIGEGPCGPDSEIFYDRGSKYDPDNLGEKLFFEELENDRYIEVWNVVFSQYDAKSDQKREDYKELPQKNIDTGMGLERLVSIIQDGETNYDTDLFLPIIHLTESMCNYKYENENKMSFRVIADHIRTVTFAIGDGANFSNEGRGYVLRRVLRRAVRYGIKLNINEPFMYKLVDVVCNNMKDYYPELMTKIDFIKKLVFKEEEAFHKTLNNGEKLLQDALNNTKDNILSGDIMFKLYDTYGFPKELTTEIADEQGYKVDIEGFNIEMEKQKQRAKQARNSESSMNSQSVDLLNFNEEFKFVGYNQLNNSSKITGLFIDGKKVNEITSEGDIALSESCFYAESGGQIADSGIIYNDNFKAIVKDVKKSINGQFLHHIEVINGTIKLNDNVNLEIDQVKRNKIKANHSSVHLLQSALKIIVGDHIHQAGSYVSDVYARFDFTHYEKVTTEQLEQIESLVNSYIFNSYPVITEVKTIEEAKKTGAIALFDEKYGETVRVVTMGDVSKEFCGGTHISNTSEIGIFKIDFEESIGSGIRRIQVKTQNEAYIEYLSYKNMINDIAKLIDVKNNNLILDKLTNIINEKNENKKQLDQLNQNALMLQADSIVNNAKEINGLKHILLEYNDLDPKKLKTFAETIRNKAKEAVIVILNKTEDNISIVVACSKLANDNNYKAGQIVKDISSKFEGKGGGRDDLAQGGVKSLNYDLIYKYTKELLNI